MTDQLAGILEPMIEDKEAIAGYFETVTRVKVQPTSCIRFESSKQTEIGSGRLDLSTSNVHLQSILDLQGSHSKSIQFVCDCLNTNFPLLVMSDDCDRFVRNLQTLSSVYAQKLNRIIVNERSDTTQLLGCFEQTSNDLDAFISLLVSENQAVLPQQVLSLSHQVNAATGNVQL